MPSPPTFSTTAADAIHVALLLAGVMALKHYIADFLFQTNRIAQGKEREKGWLGPLCLHAFGHGALTLLIALVVAPRLWWLALIDFALHFVIDRSKTVIGHRGGWKSDAVPFWWLIGFDQWLHQLTNLGLTAALLTL